MTENFKDLKIEEKTNKSELTARQIKEEQSNIQKLYSKLSKKKRMAMYREMKSIEPRMWTREHYILKAALTVLAVNFSIYNLWTIYYKHYNTHYKYFGSISRSVSAKIWLSSIVLANSFVLYINMFLIHDIVYSQHYKYLSDEDFFSMYESLIIKSQQNKKTF
jgi:hypothetical protein